MELHPFSSKTFHIGFIALLGLVLFLFVDHWAENHEKNQASLLAKDDQFDVEEEQFSSNVTLMRRDDFSCGSGIPCHNGACCGASGFCGYGATYCGSGCISNCDAVAECGVNASPSGKKCPLNTCCSQFGFCGTTEDFCGTSCQSNCVLNPSPPAGGSGKPILNKVIGYYESWNARSSCHKAVPGDLPLDALTHVNFAFAYIDPDTYQVTTMDTVTPADLFQSVTDLKSTKADLQVYVSIGGWTFSDNGTATQPLYGEIAADPAKSQSFANNVVRFMTQYGFDGLDIDWEYPGAPDRGGKPEDVDNFVSLLKTLRQTFDANSRSLGLTFTAPSSYWYLRWFDLPNLIKYADWINLMSYDLHGTWDRDNPIGSIVQGHTNLTEIKRAAELFWRVNIPPGKLVMGFGFYGRSFTLASPSCSTPGCPFSGASNPGPCTATGGILGYYEVMEILKNSPSIVPIHDETNAVKYFTFDNDQWVSYDDDVTLKQKVDWANGVGLGGALIWASDLDDKKFSAHSGLLGREIKAVPILSNKGIISPKAIVQDLASENGQDCEMFKECVDLNNPQASSCGSGYTKIGFDDAGCGSGSCHCGKPICCPVNAAPKNCIWRGGKSGDCQAQCIAGEVNIQGYGSSWGGGFLNDGNTNKCGRGYKVFCCEADNWNELNKGCKMTDCGGSCDSGYDTVYSLYDSSGKCGLFNQHRSYCCPSDTNRFTDCHWVRGSGGLECSQPVCEKDEVAVARDQFGDSLIGGCSWGRLQVNCCKLSSAPPKPITCNVDLCTTDPGYCPPSDGDDEDANIYKRGLELPYTDDDGELMTLEKRAKGNSYPVRLVGGVTIEIIAAAYPIASRLWRSAAGQRVLRRLFNLPVDECPSTTVNEGTVPSGENPAVPSGTRWDTEHPIDRSVIARYINTASTGVLQSGAFTRTRAIPNTFWLNVWREGQASLNNLPNIGGDGGISPNVPNDRVFQAMGSNENRRDLLLTDAQINGAKGRMFILRAPTALDRFRRIAEAAARSGTDADAQRMLQHIRAALAVFSYLRLPDVTTRFNRVREEIRNQLTLIENNVQGATGLSSMWDEFTDDYFRYIANNAQAWLSDAIRTARTAFANSRDGNGNPPPNAAEVEAELSSLESKIQNAELPKD